MSTIHEIAIETRDHLAELHEICDPIGLAFLDIGFHPMARQIDLDWAPKARYAIMQKFLPTRGAHGLDMMRRTATVQANFDYANEADAMKKLIVSLKLSPLVTAMFANSPFYEGAPFGGKSFRAKVWLDVEPSRQGLVPNMFREGAGYREYIEWALDAPMFLLKREGRVVANTGQSFRSFMKDGFEEHRATFADWEMHLNTMFPEVRLKRTIEARGGDSLPEDLAAALPALWTGLLYDDRALDEAAALTASFTHDELVTLRTSIPTLALQSPWRGGTLVPLAERVIEIARGGLSRRRQLDAKGRDESVYLGPLEALVVKGQCPADRLLEKIAAHPQGKSNLAAAVIDSARL
ncbi:MAG: glutamate-cysteine ligase family protein [Polyangiaceae bacterium]